MKKQDLLDLGFKPTCKGFHYLYEAVQLTIQNPLIRMGTIYNKLAEKYNETYKLIERAIRHCIQSSYSELKCESNSSAISQLAIMFSEEE